MSEVHEFLRSRAGTAARSYPWAFAGRHEEVSRILALSQSLPPEGASSQTLLIQGAPGSGKTSLLIHAQRMLDENRDWGTAPCHIETPPDTRQAVSEVYGYIAEKLAGAPPPPLFDTTQRTTKGRAGVGGISAERTHTTTSLPPVFAGAASIAAWHRAGQKEEEKGWGPEQRMIVFLDETQGVKPDSPAAELLRDLHTQRRIPVLLVCAGLSNSALRLGQAGLSRIENVLTLGGLTIEEAVDCTSRTLRQALDHGVRGEQAHVETWGGRIARAADGWPRHLHTYLQATWEALAKMPVPDLSAADIDSVMASGDAERQIYHRRRVELSGCPSYILRETHRRIQAGGGPLYERALRDTIASAMSQAPERQRKDWDERFPTLDDGIDSMLKAGVLSMDDAGAYCSPIPSLTQFALSSDDPGQPGGGDGPPTAGRAHSPAPG